MAKPTGPTNLGTRRLIAELKKLGSKEKVGLWKTLAEEIARPTRSRREVNLSRLENNLNPGEVAVIPGKVLSQGELSKKITVAAFRFSETAKTKINKAGKALSIRDLMKDNPKAKNVRIIG